MAFKIKDNLDLNGYILQNFCIDNYDSLDSISDKGDGRMVFLTGNSTDTKYRHVNVWDGTNFKALAYLDEIANNAEFIALQKKVDTLIGDGVDMDGIIESWKEVEAFLSGMSDTKSLMDLLNSKLGKNGGTISGNLTVDGNFGLTGYINAQGHYLFVRDNGNAEWVVTNKNWSSEYTLLHSGNYADQIGDYYLKTTGGTIDSGANSPLTIKGNSWSGIKFTIGEDSLGYLGANASGPIYVNGAQSKVSTLIHSGNGIISKTVEQDKTPTVNTFGLWNNVGTYFSVGYSDAYKMEFRGKTGGALMRVCQGTDSDTGWKTILTEGNVGDYALKIDGSNKMSNGVLFSDRVLTEGRSTRGTGIEMFKFSEGGSTSPTGSIYFSTLHAVSSYAGLQLAVFGGGDDNSLYYRKIGESNTWSDWKTIAFTDSDITGNAATATKLETARTIWGQSFDGTEDISGNLIIGKQSKDYTTQNYLYFWKGDGTHAHRGLMGVNETGAFYGYWNSTTGRYRELIIGPDGLAYKNSNSNNNAFTINSSGNVLIGTTEDNGAKLQLAYNSGDYGVYIKRDGTNESSVRIANDETSFVVGTWGKQFHIWNSTNLFNITEGGNVLIGTTEDNESGAKLQVNGKVSIGTDLILNGRTAIYTNSASSHFVFGSTGITSYWRGSEHIFQSGASNATAMTINSSRNVLIDATEDSGKNGKLIVGTGATIHGYTAVNSITKVSDLDGKGLCISALKNRDAWGMVMWVEGNGNGFIQQQSFGDNATTYALSLNPFGGNVGIGTAEPDEKLHVVGNLHVTGNIIADGEVSAGGVGEEGSAGAGSGSQMYATTIAEGTTTKDIAHGLATDDIVISIYEKDSTSGLWNMVLTDIEITDANNIRVTFGSATTVEHKVVIFGAVA